MFEDKITFNLIKSEINLDTVHKQFIPHSPTGECDGFGEISKVDEHFALFSACKLCIYYRTGNCLLESSCNLKFDEFYIR